jgi:predicted AAA+ superfamily ATPase
MYYRDKDQNEVDFVLENQAGALIGLEVKAAASVSKSDLTGLRRFRQAAGDAFQRGLVLYDGAETLPLGDDFWAVPFGVLWDVGGWAYH